MLVSGLPIGLTSPLVLATGVAGPGALLQALGVTLPEGADAGRALREQLAPLAEGHDLIVQLALPEAVRGEFGAWLRGEAGDLSPAVIEALLEVRGIVLQALSSKAGPSHENPGGVETEATTEVLPVMAEETAREILTRLGRANFFPDRGPPGPTSYQVSQFVRGYDAVREAMRRLGGTPEQVREDPHLLSRGVTAIDFDGTAINSTWNTAEVAWRGLLFFINRDLIRPLRRIAKISELDTDVTICTAWRVGLVDYLLGATHALGGGYPFMTYGWSRRPATMAYEDPAARAIFLGHGYRLEDALTRAQEAYRAEGEEKEWEGLTQEQQRKRVIDAIEQNLLASRSFMTTEHLGEAAIQLLERLAAGPLEWEATPWTEDEIERLEFLLGRPSKDFLRPGGGFSIHRGAKIPSWAHAAGKTNLVASLTYGGLADDAPYHVAPLVRRGGRGILVEGGREFLPVRGEGDHASTLLSTHYLDGSETDRITRAMEEPYDPGQGGKEIRVPKSPAKPAVHPRGEVHLQPFQMEVAARVLRNPSATAPVELDFRRDEFPVEAPLLQHNGVRWKVEDATVNGLRHGVVAAEMPLSDRARLAFWSGIEVGVARVVSNIVSRGGPAPFDAIEFALFAALGFAGETLFGRTASGRVTPMLLGGTMTMAAASGLSEAIDSSAAVTFHPFGSLVFGAVYTGLQMVAQRSLIPAAVVSYARRITTPLANKKFRRARNILWRGRLLAKGISLAATTAISWISRFFV